MQRVFTCVCIYIPELQSSTKPPQISMHVKISHILMNGTPVVQHSLCSFSWFPWKPELIVLVCMN